jgi:formate dehydrogenase subunit gamma
MGTMTSEGLRQLIAPHANAIGGPLTALRTLQDQLGWIDADALAAVADVFNLSRAEVRGLVAFYPDFRTRPPARHLIRVCQAEACQAVGGRELTATISTRLGVGLGETTPEGGVELGAVYCLGLCARGPAMVVDGDLVVGADATVERILDGLGHG